MKSQVSEVLHETDFRDEGPVDGVGKSATVSSTSSEVSASMCSSFSCKDGGALDTGVSLSRRMEIMRNWIQVS